jgi:hypothetical protein
VPFLRWCCHVHDPSNRISQHCHQMLSSFASVGQIHNHDNDESHRCYM